MNELTNEQYMTVSEVATVLSVGERTIHKKIKKLAHDHAGVFKPRLNTQGGYMLDEELMT